MESFAKFLVVTLTLRKVSNIPRPERQLGLFVKAVLDFKIGSKYKDDIWWRYDIPNRNQVDLVRECLDDWVIFRRTGSSKGAYIAVARVVSIEPDPERPSFFFARIQDYLAFPRAVPLRPDGHLVETHVLSVARPSQIGQFFQRNPIRRLWDADFDDIVKKGFARTVDIEHDKGSLALEPTGFGEVTVEAWYNEPTLRRVDEVLRHIPFRAANFRLNVGQAYGYRCAFTGLRLMDSPGHYEAHAAHLWSVAEGGPDIVRNGICANQTVHWALDQHLLSIDEFNRPMVARNAELYAYLQLFPDFGAFITLPTHATQSPNPAFLAHHRAAFLRKNGVWHVQDRAGRP